METSLNQTHELYMKRAQELATRGVGYVSPNPLVGCVIVFEGQIIGEGWHKMYGEAHAEVNAIHAVSDKSLLKQSTLYVNLEPCSHFGKTPPCADLIIQHQIPSVVISNVDTNPLVGGGGIKKLRTAGIRVISDVLSKEGQQLNKRFFTSLARKRPYIILKWAETSDGFMARKNNDSKWISDEYSRQLVHKWRTEEDAVLVGSGTAWYDNPKLNVRDWSGRDPIRVVIDRFLKLSVKQNLFNELQQTICYNLLKDETQKNLMYVRLPKENFLGLLVKNLFDQNIHSIIIEGGSQILNGFIAENLWDEARVFISPQHFKEGILAPRLTGVFKHEWKLQEDWLKILHPLS